MSKQLTLGSLFDGSGGFPLGGMLAGIKPVWASELEPFAIRVTTKRLPFMMHLGDVTKINGGETPPVDIITFGSPCQDMSLAGKRNGLHGSRSSLFFEAVRIIKEMREKTNGQYPRYCVWENVFGAFSSNKGEDFKAVLEAIIGISCPETEVPMPEKGQWAYADVLLGDGWSVAYRTLDAQYWGVPQRRKRIFLVADFNGGGAGDILFKSEGLSGYSAEMFRTWQAAARNTENCPGETGFCDLVLNDQGGQFYSISRNVSGTLRAQANAHQPLVMEDAASVKPLDYNPCDGRIGLAETMQTLTHRMGTGGNNVPLLLEDTPKLLKVRSGCDGGGKGALVQNNKSATLGCNNDQTLFEPITYRISSDKSNAMLSDNPNSGISQTDKARTLDGNGGNPGCNQGGIAVVAVEGNGARPSHHGDGFNVSDKMYTLNTVEQHSVAYDEAYPKSYGLSKEFYDQGENGKFNFVVSEEIGATLVAKGPTAVCGPTYCASKASYFTAAEEEKANTLVATDFKDPPLINSRAETNYIVRRLTPTECARLQGFPDWWCSNLESENPSEEEIAFWKDVFETYRLATGSSTKAKTEKQLRKWLASPHTDSAEYKLWGNGVALPCVYFVLSGIAWSNSKSTD